MSVVGGGLNGSMQHFILKEEMECMQMKNRYGRGFSAAEKTALWDRWQRGESLKAIGRAFGKARRKGVGRGQIADMVLEPGRE